MQGKTGLGVVVALLCVLLLHEVCAAPVAKAGAEKSKATHYSYPPWGTTPRTTRVWTYAEAAALIATVCNVLPSMCGTTNPP